MGGRVDLEDPAATERNDAADHRSGGELYRPANSRRANNCTPISNDHRSVWLNHYVCAGATALNDLLSPGRYYGIYRTAAARHRLRAAAVNKTGAIGAEHAFSAVANDMGSYNHRACGSVQDAPRRWR